MKKTIFVLLTIVCFAFLAGCVTTDEKYDGYHKISI